MNIVFVIIGYAIIVLFDMVPLIKNGKKKVKLLYTSIIILSFVLSALLAFDVKIPSPIPYYEKILMNLYKGL